jgi:ribosomal protein L21E
MERKLDNVQDKEDKVMKANDFKIGDKVIIHCNNTRDEYRHKFYDNQVGKIIHIYDLDKNPWGNIVVILENRMQNGFFAKELEPVSSENNKENL